MKNRLVVVGMLLVTSVCACADQELARSTWQIPSHEETHDQVANWLADSNTAEDVVTRVLALWAESIQPSDRLNVLAESFGLVDSDGRELVEFCQSYIHSGALPEFPVLEASDAHPFLQNHLRLLYSRWLSHHRRYDESLEQIVELEPKDVVDPASLLFYKSVALHRLLKKDECLPLLDQLLEQEAELPKRYRTLAGLIQSDLKPLKPDSLDEVSRLMDSIQVRLGHGHAGKRVRKEEDDVISKLDKMIKKLEEQQQQQQAAASAGQAGDSLNPSQPMSDSMPGGASGPGNVDPREIAKKGGWGNLPKREKQQALQQLGKDFPSHYRNVIEEYFRKLASEESDPPR